MIAKITSPTMMDEPTPPSTEQAPDASRLSLLPVLWRRRWTVLLTLLVCIAGAGVYLLKATPVFTSTSSISVDQFGAQMIGDGGGALAKSGSYLHRQVKILKSPPILGAALDKLDWRRMKTFAGVGNPAAALQQGNALRVDVGKKDDVITVSFDSPYPQEAAAVVNSIVDAYVTHQSLQKKKTAAELLKIFETQKKHRDDEVASQTAAMLKFQEDNGALSFSDDKGNIIIQKLATLSTLLTTAEMRTREVSAKHAAAKAVLADPTSIPYFVQSLQNSASQGDREYEVLRGRLREYQFAITSATQTSGPNSHLVRNLQANVAELEKQIADKERLLAEAHLVRAELERVEAAEELKSVRAAFEAQKQEALALNLKKTGFAQLQASVQRAQKQSDDLDALIKKVDVNSEDSGNLNVQVLDVARAEDKPTHPRPTMTMAAALLVGLMLGSCLALTREWVDQRIRTADEAAAALGLPVLGVVPHIQGKHTPAVRGQYVHHQSMSDVAEAYRTVRTAIHFGTTRGAKTVLVTSPAPGDGKSTTASNLAIALAQAGHRTMLIDCDFRKPVQHTIYELGDEVGLSSVIAGTAKLRDAVRRTSIGRLYVLPCGPVPSNPSEILTSKRFEQVMKAMDAAFDRIVIDSPPVAPVADASILAASSDATVLVLRTNKSTRKLSAGALEALYAVGANVLGAVVNDAPRRKSGFGYYAGGYYGSYGVSRRPAPALDGG
jgi:polysaccharide biosynthesis transport protein